MNFIDDNNLINSRPDEIHAENASLWTLEYIIVRNLCEVPSISTVKALYDFFESCKIRPGLYNQRDFKDGSDDDYMSHDQLTAICCLSFMYDLNMHKEIWKEIKRQRFFYDNINPDKPRRFLHPRDIIFYGILNNVLWCRLLFPLFALTQIISCKNEKETSGKLLAFVRTGSTLSKLPYMEKLFKVLTHTIRANKTIGSWSKVFNIYFPHKDHPTIKFIESQKSKKNWLN